MIGVKKSFLTPKEIDMNGSETAMEISTKYILLYVEQQINFIYPAYKIFSEKEKLIAKITELIETNKISDIEIAGERKFKILVINSAAIIQIDEFKAEIQKEVNYQVEVALV